MSWWIQRIHYFEGSKTNKLSPVFIFSSDFKQEEWYRFYGGEKKTKKTQVFLKAEAIKMQVGSSGQSSDCPESYTAKPSRMNLNDNLKWEREQIYFIAIDS